MPSAARVIVLAEDTLAATGLETEGGFSALVEYGGKRILFDTGLAGACVRNAQELGVELRGLDAVVLSHAHGDHTGGLADVLRAAGKVDVLVGRGFFQPKVCGGRSIGPPLSREAYEELGAAFDESDEPRRIGEGLCLVGSIPRREKWETTEGRLQVLTDGGAVPDPFDEEQALACETGEGLAVVVGCSHRGVVNAVLQAIEVTGRKEVALVIGGTHLGPMDEERTRRTAEELVRLNVKKVAAVHCTGGARKKLRELLGDRWLDAGCGSAVELE